MDAPEGLSSRASRALPLIAGALAATVVVSLIYLYPQSPKTKAPAPIPSPSPSLLSNHYSGTYDFVTPSTGWALIVEQTASSPQVFVFRTTDGARHWQKQFTGISSGFGTLAIQFFDRTRGLISFGDPGQLYRTGDAGGHWEPVQLPRYSTTSIAFSDPSHGWLLGVSDANSGFIRHFFATINGGSSWAELAWPPWARWQGKGGFGDLNFRRPSDGWLGASAAEPTVYTTIDGGASWQPHVLPSPPKPSPGVGVTGGKPLPLIPSGAAYTTDLTLLPGVGVIAFSTDYYGNSAAYTSFDGGTTWRSLPPTPGETAFSDFVYQDSFHWWAMRFGTLWKTSDAGQTWKHASQQIDDWDYRPHVIDANHAWAELVSSVPRQVQGPGLAMTSDGGLHWTQVNTPQPS